MQHFLHFKTDTHLNPQHKVQYNDVDVVYVYYYKRLYAPDCF